MFELEKIALMYILLLRMILMFEILFFELQKVLLLAQQYCLISLHIHYFGYNLFNSSGITY